MRNRDDLLVEAVGALAVAAASALVGWVDSWGESLHIIGVSPTGDFLIRFAAPPVLGLSGLLMLLYAALMPRE